jgi:hypothetical protein
MAFHMTTKRVVTSLLAVGIVATSAIGFSLAYLNCKTAPTVNHLTLAASNPNQSIKANITEPDYNPAAALNLLPGDMVPKDPFLINTSTMDQSNGDGSINPEIGNEYGALQVVFQGQTNVVPDGDTTEVVPSDGQTYVKNVVTTTTMVAGTGTVASAGDTVTNGMLWLENADGTLTAQPGVTVVPDDTNTYVINPQTTTTTAPATAADASLAAGDSLDPGDTLWIANADGTYTAAPLITFDLTNAQIAQLYQVMDIPDLANLTNFQMDPAVAGTANLFASTNMYQADPSDPTSLIGPTTVNNMCANGTVYFYSANPTVQDTSASTAGQMIGYPNSGYDVSTSPATAITGGTDASPVNSSIGQGIIPSNPSVGASYLTAANTASYPNLPDPADTTNWPGLDAISSQPLFTQVLVDPMNADNGTIWGVSQFAPAGINIVINGAVVQARQHRLHRPDGPVPADQRRGYPDHRLLCHHRYGC